MNDLNLAKILKDCPKDWVLYSPVCGYVHFIEIAAYDNIVVVDRSGNTLRFMSNGMYRQNGECLLFPSYSNRDWSNFSAPWYNPNQQQDKKNGKFDPRSLQPFDNVLVRDKKNDKWSCSIFSHIKESERYGDYFICIHLGFMYCIPYNDETKHLIGTKNDAPEYYRDWEE